MKTVPAQIMRRMRACGRGGRVFTPSDFFDLGDRTPIDQALSRLARKGTIRRLARGLYDYPRTSSRLGPISPTPDRVAQAIARKTHQVIQVSGAQAANALGLSTQVPAHAVYLTDGPSRQVAIGKTVVDLRHASPKHLIAPGTKAGAVVQALRFLGKDAGQQIAGRVQLSVQDRSRLIHGAAVAPNWMRPTLNRIARAAVTPA